MIGRGVAKWKGGRVGWNRGRMELGRDETLAGMERGRDRAPGAIKTGGRYGSVGRDGTGRDKPWDGMVLGRYGTRGEQELMGGTYGTGGTKGDGTELGRDRRRMGRHGDGMELGAGDGMETVEGGGG